MSQCAAPLGSWCAKSSTNAMAHHSMPSSAMRIHALMDFDVRSMVIVRRMGSKRSRRETQWQAPIGL